MNHAKLNKKRALRTEEASTLFFKKNLNSFLWVLLFYHVKNSKTINQNSINKGNMPNTSCITRGISTSERTLRLLA